MLQPGSYNRGTKRFSESDCTEERREKVAFTQKKVIDFECKALLQGQVFDIRLSQMLKDAKYVLLFFYSYDFTEQAKYDLQQIENFFYQFTSLGAIPLAISHDQIPSHTAFSTPGFTKNSLPFVPSFPLLTDGNDRLISVSYNSLQIDIKRMKRTVVIINNKMQQVFHLSIPDNRYFPMTKIVQCLTQ